MGCVCSCFNVPDAEESAGTAGSDTNNHCIRFNFLIQNLKNKYGALFHNEGMHEIPSSQGPTSSNSATVVDTNTSSSNGTSSQNNSRLTLQDNVVISRNDKGPGHSIVVPVPLEELYGEVLPKAVGSFCGGSSEDYHSAASVNNGFSENVDIGVEHTYPSSDEEDVCPTCLEEYTPENPKIITQCKHHYHLSCIYEWMERSETCPVCMKKMVFSETT